MAELANVEVGDKFGYLTVIEEVERWVYPSGDTRRQFVMQCDCGSVAKRMLISNFKTGSTKSCGCYNKAKNTSHGMHDTRQYQCWADMKTRCDCTDNKFYDYYGGRGIKYCDKWKTFEGFWEDMADGYSNELTINRRNNDEGYSKENCRWDTKTFQGHQRRKLKGTLYNVIGATESSTGRINASIRFDPWSIHLGAYETETEVAEAYDYAAEDLYGDRPNKTTITRPEIAIRVQRYLDNRDVELQCRGSDNWNATLTEQGAIEIWDLLKSKQFIQADIATMYNVKPAVVSSISKGGAWVHVTKAPRVFRVKHKYGIGKVFKLTVRELQYYTVQRDVKGERVVRKSFSIRKLGEVVALGLAEEARLNWIKSYEEAECN